MPFVKPGRRWEGNIRTGLDQISWKDLDLIDLAEDEDRWRTVVNTVIKLRLS